MRTIAIFKAQPAISSEPVGSVKIVIDDPFPDVHGPGSVAKANAIHEEQGKKIAEVLCSALAGGTLDALTAELLRRKATSLVVLRDGR